MPLAPDGPLRGDGLDLLRRTAAADLFDGEPADAAFAECVRSGLFLYLSALDESHKISQGVSSDSGSYWHGIMHRQEPDFSNAKYWFRRTGEHAVFPELREAAVAAVADEAGAAALELRESIDGRPSWDPFWFVDQCEAARRGRGKKSDQSLMKIQSAEWAILFDYCCRRAAGRG